MDTLSLIFVICGAVLILLEFILPGGISFSLGCGAIIVAGLRYFDIIDSPLATFGLWPIISLGLVIIISIFVQKVFGGRTTKVDFDEDIDAFGHIANVVKTLNDKEPSGRIRFKGTTWPAICREGTISKGSKVKIVVRENINWVVEPLTPLDEL